MKKREVFIGFTAILATISALSIASCGRTEMALKENATSKIAEVTSEKEGKTITVTANTTVQAEPDLADLDFAVSTQGADIKAAQSENAKIADEVIKQIKDFGINEKNIKTSDYSIYPQYNYDNPEGTTITGYNLYNTMTVSGIPIKDTGALIEACTAAGINEINNISYHISNYDEIYNEAMEKALTEAKEKAEHMAKASGKTLGDIKAINENAQDNYLGYTGLRANLDSAKESGDLTVMPGLSDVTADITVTYYLY